MEINNFDFISELGLGGIFLGSVIEALGLPFPGAIMLIFAGVLISNGKLGYMGALLLAVIGFNLGAATAFFLGRVLGEPVLSKLQGIFKLNERKLKQSKRWMKESAVAFILLGRFVPMASNLTPYLAGISGMKTVKFLFYNTIFALLWSNFNLGLGFFFSRSLQQVMEYTQKYTPYVAAGLLIIYIAIALIIKKRAKI